MTACRQTTELPPDFVVEPMTTYSVSKRRATTADDRDETGVRVERVALSPERPRPSRASSSAEANYRVEVSTGRVRIISDVVTVELPLAEARSIAEQILRATS